MPNGSTAWIHVTGQDDRFRAELVFPFGASLPMVGSNTATKTMQRAKTFLRQVWGVRA